MEENIESSTRSHKKVQLKRTKFELRRLKEKGVTTASNHLELFKSGQWSDFTIVCQQDTFNVHRTIIFGHSQFFDSAINGTFKEGIERKLDLSNEDPAALSMVLWFIYAGQLDYKNERHCLHNVMPGDDHENFLKLLIHVARLADFLLMHECFRAVRYRFQLEVCGIVKEIIKTRDPSSYVGLLECISVAFDSDQDVSSNMFEIQKILAWALVTGNSKRRDEKEPLLSNTELEMQNEQYPTLGMHLYRLVMEIERDDKFCDSCLEPCFDGTEPRWAYIFKRDLTVKPRWISCICNFRGLCSVDCLASDRQLCLSNTGCEDCREHSYEECNPDWVSDYDFECVCERGYVHQKEFLYQERCCDDSPYYFKLEASKPKYISHPHAKREVTGS